MSDNDTFCNRHNAHPNDEEWKVALDELTSEEGDECLEPFRGQVCPLCFIALRDKLRRAKRELKVQSLQNIRLRQEVEELRRLQDAVVATVKGVTGKDAIKLAEQEYAKSVLAAGGVTGEGQSERGDLKNILPNLIVEAIHQHREAAQ